MSELKLISVLMDYPHDELWQHGDELRSAAETQPFDRLALSDFVNELLSLDPMQAQERWLSLFDRGRSMSLLIFEHIHGESRDRGQAMVDLLTTYQNAGFDLATKELPDYLPLVLEFLSRQPEDEAQDWLRHIRFIIELLAARAIRRHSSYASLFRYLLHWMGESGDLGVVCDRAAAEERDDTPEFMDRVWEEEAVRFGTDAPSQDCVPHTRKKWKTDINHEQVVT